MSDYQAIADAGNTLIKLLDEEMNPDKSYRFVLCSPADAAKDVNLSLYLYRIVENSYLKNQEMIKIGDSQLKHTPLVLDLYYLVTAYASKMTPAGDKAREEHKLLGRAMQVFYDHAVIDDLLLEGNLKGSGVELKVTMDPLPLEVLTGLWTTFPNLAYKTSLSYLVTPVMIDSTRQMPTSLVQERDLRISTIKEGKSIDDYVDRPDERMVIKAPEG